MIIVDFSQVTYSTLMVQLGFDSSKLGEVNEDMLRHMILNCLRSYNLKYKSEYREMVIACDSTSWRKDVFPYYKANRKKTRDASELDWERLYGMVNRIRDEIKEYTPYKVISVDKAEADDIISALVRQGEELNYLILSGDKDFIQLHKPNIKQYDPTRKKWVSSNMSPKDYLFEHIIKGDTGDGIPNILSNDNCLVIGERQKSITQKRMDTYKDEEGFKNLLTNPWFEKNYRRNRQLIDLTQTPADIKTAILENYNQQVGKDRSKLLNYFMDKKLKILTEHISEF